jgi:hypothetical protein
MLATRSLTEEQVTAGMMVTLPSETSKGLSKTEIDEVKLLVHLSKEAGDTAGKAMMACAEHLSAVKKIVKKKGWTALCDSGALGMGSKQAQMLALCQERLFATGLVPSNAVANVSVTTLYLMASADEKKKSEMIAAMVEAGGNGFTEKEARAIKNKGKNLKKMVKMENADIAKTVKAKAEDMSKAEVVAALVKAEQGSHEYKMNYGQYKIYSKLLIDALKKAKVAVPELPDAIEMEAA